MQVVANLNDATDQQLLDYVAYLMRVAQPDSPAAMAKFIKWQYRAANGCNSERDFLLRYIGHLIARANSYVVPDIKSIDEAYWARVKSRHSSSTFNTPLKDL